MFCMNWEIKCSWCSGQTVSSLKGSVEDQAAKPFEYLQYLVWKLVLYSCLKIIKIKTVVNKRLIKVSS